MPDTKKIVDKAWNFAHVLRDDGLSYMAYTEQITFLLFLKMADEQSKPPYNKKIGVPEGLDWASLLRRSLSPFLPLLFCPSQPKMLQVTWEMSQQSPGK